MAEHTLKCWPSYFDALERGDKNFEVRQDDRGFQRGDVLILRKFNPNTGTYFLRGPDFVEVRRTITYILTGGRFGVEPGYVVMALEPTEKPNAGRSDLGGEQQEAAE